MSISASQVKELRERTGAGMMECKKALVESGGDVEAAIEAMRKSGQAKADKKASRVAAEGAIFVRHSEDGQRAAMIEINCETDFVAGDQNFRKFGDQVTTVVIENQIDNVDTLAAQPLDGQTVEEVRRELIAKIGENIQVRRIGLIESSGVLSSYLHGTRIGAIVNAEGGDAELARDVAMHISWSNPMCISEQDVPADTLAKEREILTEQAATEGKPEEIVQRMVDGRMKKYLAEITLLGQAFVKDPDTTVGKLLSGRQATVRSFLRFEVGEGIEKKTENFAEEVMAQVQGS